MLMKQELDCRSFSVDDALAGRLVKDFQHFTREFLSKILRVEQ
jgi:hypothetical protein